MSEAGLIIARFLHYAALMGFFGGSLFPLYARPRGVDPQPARFGLWLRGLPIGAVILALLSGLAWLVFTAANMAGSLTEAMGADTLRSVLLETDFGGLWLARLVLCILLLGAVSLPLSFRSSRGGRVFVCLLSGVLLASLAGTGHTQTEDGIGRFVHMSGDALHVLGAAAWLGGLLPLAFFLSSTTQARSAGDRDDAVRVLLRFSGMGYVAVAVLLASGLVNSWFLVRSLSNLFTTPYGQLLTVKLCLFAGMIALAATNRFWLVPAVIKADPSSSARLLSRLRSHVLTEEALGVAVVGIVSVLGTMAPAVG